MLSLDFDLLREKRTVDMEEGKDSKSSTHSDSNPTADTYQQAGFNEFYGFDKVTAKDVDGKGNENEDDDSAALFPNPSKNLVATFGAHSFTTMNSRKRTESIEKFLSLSPGFALGTSNTSSVDELLDDGAAHAGDGVSNGVKNLKVKTGHHVTIDPSFISPRNARVGGFGLNFDEATNLTPKNGNGGFRDNHLHLPTFLSSPSRVMREHFGTIGDDLTVDSVGKHLVALDLSVDNHRSQYEMQRPDYSLSGSTSMTPNPRSGYKSPDRVRRKEESLGLGLKSMSLAAAFDAQDDDNGDLNSKSMDEDLFSDSLFRITSSTPPPKKSSPLHNPDRKGLNSHLLSPPPRVAAYKQNSRKLDFGDDDGLIGGSLQDQGHEVGMSFDALRSPTHSARAKSPSPTAGSLSPSFGKTRGKSNYNDLFSNFDHQDFNVEHSLGKGFFDSTKEQRFHQEGQYPPGPAHVEYNLAPMQQIVLPNGMTAMVVPMDGMNGMPQFNQNQFQFQQERMGYEANPMFHQGIENGGANDFRKPRGKSPVHSSLLRSDSSARMQTQNPAMAPNGGANAIPVETPLSEFKDRLFQLSQEQNGCRYLQQKVDEEREAACVVILHEVRPRLVQLMMDPFGNYLFQKLLEHVSDFQRLEMLQRVKSNLVQAALNLHGTRSVQKFIEVCGTKSKNGKPDMEQMSILVECLSPAITKLSMDTNGNHVVQRCLQHMPNDVAQFVYDAAVRDVLVITRHRHGCCVFQRCIDAANEGQRKCLVGEVVRNAIQLMQDPFGNYVVQYVLDNARKDESDALIAQLLGRLAQLSMQKFSSNVVEKCLLVSANGLKGRMIDELAKPETMRNLLHDQFANYVIQRALLVAEDELGMRLVSSIRPHIADLAQFNPSCARRVTSRVVKRFPSLSQDIVFSAHWQNESNPGLNSLNRMNR